MLTGKKEGCRVNFCVLSGLRPGPHPRTLFCTLLFSKNTDIGLELIARRCHSNTFSLFVTAKMIDCFAIFSTSQCAEAVYPHVSLRFDPILKLQSIIQRRATRMAKRTNEWVVKEPNVLLDNVKKRKLAYLAT